MTKLFFRLIVRYFSRWLPTDHFADFFPVSVKGLLLEDGKLLLLKNERGEWDLPGGKIVKNGNLKGTLVREIKEETNLNITVKGFVLADLFKVLKSEVFITIFSVESMDNDPILISKEHVSYDLFALNEIKELNTSIWVKEAISLINVN